MKLGANVCLVCGCGLHELDEVQEGLCEECNNPLVADAGEYQEDIDMLTILDESDMPVNVSYEGVED
jgi:hypothetical protein